MLQKPRNNWVQLPITSGLKGSLLAVSVDGKTPHLNRDGIDACLVASDGIGWHRMASDGIGWHGMASNGKKKSKRPSACSKRNSLAPRIGRTNSTARKLHASADAAHQQAQQAHKRAESAHKKVGSLHGLRAQAAESPVGKARPPKRRITILRSRKPAGRLYRQPSSDRATSRLPFTIVGIGASAGGLEALSELLAHPPRETGMAIVIPQHLDPTHESHLGQLLARATKIPVLDIATGCGRNRTSFMCCQPTRV